jgi:hypothetical protein
MPELTAELTKELEKLRKALQSGRNDIVPFVGAGLSCPPLPGWRDLLDGFAGQASEPAQSSARASLADGKLREAAAALEDPTVHGPVAKALATLAAKPDGPRPGAYAALVALPLQHFVTGNRDPWLKEALQEKLGATPRVYLPNDANALADLSPQSGPLVLMLHGDAERAETVVLTEAGYKTLGKGPRSYAGALKSLVGSRKILFLGCSPQDPDVAALLDEWAELFGADEAAGLGAPRHFFLGSGLSEPEKELLLKLRIRPIEIGAPGDPNALGQALAYLSGTAPPPGVVGLESTRSQARPAPTESRSTSRVAEPSRAEPPPAAAPAKEKYDPVAKLRVGELETSLKAREADLAAANAQLAAANAQAARVPELEATIAQLQAHDAEAKKLEEEIAHAFERRDAEATKLEQEVAALKAELASAPPPGTAPSADLANQVQNLEANVAQLDQVRAELEQRARGLESEKRELELRLGDMEETLAARNEAIKKFEEVTHAAPANPEVGKQVKALEEKVVALEKNRVALEAEGKKLRANLDTAKNERTSLAEKAQKERAAEKAALQSQLAEAHAKLADAEKARGGKLGLILAIVFGLILALAAAVAPFYQPGLFEPLRGVLNSIGIGPGGGGSDGGK